MKLLLVDDEPRQLKALSNVIAMLQPETEVMTCDSGIEAVERLKKESFDVLITDIKMPEMDGLQLIEKLNQLNLKLKIIILSGYGEFEYAQKAIQFGVNHYLIKPVKKNDLNEILSEMNTKIQLERTKESKSRHMERQLETTLPIYMDHQFNKWINRQLGDQEQLELREIFPPDFHGFVMICDLLNPSEFQTSQAAVPTDFDDILKELRMLTKQVFNDLGHTISFYHESNPLRLVSIISTDGAVRLNKISTDKLLHKYVQTLYEISGLKVCLGISRLDNRHIEEIPQMYEESSYAMKFHFFDQNMTVFYYESVAVYPLNKNYVLESMEERLIEAIDRLDRVECTQLIWKRIKEEMLQFEPELLKRHWLLVLRHCYEYFKLSLAIEQKSSYYLEMEKSILVSSDMNRLHTSVNHYIHELIDRLSSNRDDINGIIISKCQKYITEHVNEEYTLEETASRYHFNPAYFSNLFKSYVGISFTKYVTKVKMDHAIVLLKTTDDSMKAISTQIGINDPAYFNRLFKKEIGMSPNKYRQMNMLR